jgi:anthranilate phosphoribosyltransferase
MAHALARVLAGTHLTRDEAAAAMAQVMAGEAPPAQLAALLAGLVAKGEQVEEIAGFALAMRDAAVPVLVPEGAVDTCGTGGDGSSSFNVSTTCAFVVAGAGVPVAKHGNRAMSSQCGSADVLEALGAAVELDAAGVARVLEHAGITFMYAPNFHPAMRHAAPVRRELGIRTVFNIVGPLLNPAKVRAQVVGVAHPQLAHTMALVLAELGVERALVVHGTDGLDELSIAAPSVMHELRDGVVTRTELTPEGAGLRRADLAALVGGDRHTNAAITRSVLGGETGARRDVVVLNAAAALVAAGAAQGVADGVRMAADAIDTGAASDALDRFVTGTVEAAADAAGEEVVA